MEFEFSVFSVRSWMKRNQFICHDLSANSRKDKTLIAEASINVSAFFNFFIQILFETLFERNTVKVYFFETQTGDARIKLRDYFINRAAHRMLFIKQISESLVYRIRSNQSQGVSEPVINRLEVVNFLGYRVRQEQLIVPSALKSEKEKLFSAE